MVEHTDNCDSQLQWTTNRKSCDLLHAAISSEFQWHSRLFHLLLHLL